MAVLYMGMMVHMAARVISADGAVSRQVVPSNSILAGCMQSVCWTRLYLWDILDEAHRSYRPVSIKAW
eukprot:5044504-Lingulodinium_polyedra.AAC.1